MFVVDDGKARQRSLRIGLRNEELVEVVAGLQAADTGDPAGTEQGQGRAGRGSSEWAMMSGVPRIIS